jgi:hypothetical protein
LRNVKIFFWKAEFATGIPQGVPGNVGGGAIAGGVTTTTAPVSTTNQTVLSAVTETNLTCNLNKLLLGNSTNSPFGLQLLKIIVQTLNSLLSTSATNSSQSSSKEETESGTKN